jgi:hypothetical protein
VYEVESAEAVTEVESAEAVTEVESAEAVAADRKVVAQLLSKRGR